LALARLWRAPPPSSGYPISPADGRADPVAGDFGEAARGVVSPPVPFPGYDQDADRRQHGRIDKPASLAAA